MKLSFYGGAQSVTGANYLLEIGDKRIIIECGLVQGGRFAEQQNRATWAYDPKAVDALFVTHAHADHIGRVPKLVKDGFAGAIYATPATLDLTALTLEDSAHIIMEEAEEHGEQPLYTENDVTATIRQFSPLEYHIKKEIFPGIIVELFDSGHILGSSMISFEADGQRIVFTGDLGNSPAPLLRSMEQIDRADYVIIESAYGNRAHEDRGDRKKNFERVIEDTVARGGALMIPAFSIERTQEMLFELNELVEHKRIPRIPIYVDSPLAINATELYKKYERYFNKEAQYIIASGDAVFQFPGLHMTLSREDSMAINDAPNPKIIIAGSGMSEGGRILHHEKRYLPDPKSTLLIIGFQANGTRGRQLVEGAKEVSIHGKKIRVRARVESIRGYSAHADADALYSLIAHIERPIKKVFVVQGEPDASQALVFRIRDHLGVPAVAPSIGDSFEL